MGSVTNIRYELGTIHKTQPRERELKISFPQMFVSFAKFRTIENNKSGQINSDLTIKSDNGQHSQFLYCLIEYEMFVALDLESKRWNLSKTTLCGIPTLKHFDCTRLWLAFGRQSLVGSSGGYTSHASPRACGARLGQIVKSV